jgi:selenocysteine lyase/cysteine desulfurase
MHRNAFDVPRDVAYWNTASYSPLPKATQAAGRAAIDHKARPWDLPADFISSQNEGVRAAAARLIHADPNDVALVSSVGYGIATAAKIIAVARGSRVLVLEDDHTSPVLEWHVRAEAGGFTVDTIPAPANHDWTSAVLAAIDRPGAAPIALLSISSVHWADGAMLDMGPIAAAAKRAGAALIVDATQHIGAMPFDVRALDPDVVVFPTYKWLLGPYGRAFMYVAKRRQTGVPLEQTAHGRIDVRAESARYFGDLSYRADARRYDMGERDHFVSMPMTAASLEFLARLGPETVAAHTRAMTDALAEGLAGLPLTLTPRAVRAPHVLSLSFPRGMPADLPKRLAAQKVFAAPRLGRLRFAPHVYVDAADVERTVQVVRAALA